MEVHCWGGLGSQLFALALIHDLELRFPNHNFKLVLHSSGVTHRAPEILNMPFAKNVKFIDDFSPTFQVNSRSRLRVYVRNILKKNLLWLGFVAKGDTDKEFRNIRPWVRQIRGHYSQRSISSSFLLNLKTFLDNKANPNAPTSNNIVIHYRLGDLILLVEKNPIKVERLASEVLRVKRFFPGKVLLFSDSAKIAFQSMASQGVICETNDSINTGIDVINLARNANYFVGTSSKISYWIVCLRHYSENERTTSMPTSDEPNLSLLIGSKISNHINFY